MHLRIRLLISPRANVVSYNTATANIPSNILPARRRLLQQIPNRAERINNTMRNELLKGKVFRSIEEVIASVALAVDFYNNRRPHISIGMMTPVEASESTGDRDMRWKSYRHLAIKSRDNLDTPENSLSLPER